MDLAGLPPAQRAAAVTRLAESGATSVRLPLDWNRVEPQPGRFTWEADDAAAKAAIAEGLEVVLVLGPCAEWAVDPAWEVPADQRRNSIPKSLAVWERYVRQAVTHFRGRVRHWQVREQPNLRNFRGPRSDYLRLLEAAARVARGADPKSVILLPESGSLDIAEIDRLAQSDTWESFDVLGLYPQVSAESLSGAALAWAVLTHEVMGAVGRRPVWVLGTEGDVLADLWVQHYLLCSAFGVERFYLPPHAISREWVAPLADLTYRGYLRLGPDLWALTMEGHDGPVVAAWGPRELEVPAHEVAPVADVQAVNRAAFLGGAPGSAVASEGVLRLGPRPALIQGLEVAGCSVAGAPTREAVLAARPGPDLGALPLVYADYGMPERAEFGLASRSLRTLPGGEVGEEERGGRLCLRTRMRPGRGEEELDNPWIYFDVDDRWLYLARGATRVAVTVECEGSFLGEKKLGFNLMYDATGGYRFTSWQWVAPGYQWRRYRFELEDVSFANRRGYDFRINAKGSKQDLWVAAVTVEKLPPSAPSEAATGATR